MTCPKARRRARHKLMAIAARIPLVISPCRIFNSVVRRGIDAVNLAQCLARLKLVKSPRDRAKLRARRKSAAGRKPRSPKASA